MAEQLNNEFTVNRPIDEAWPIITNVEKIAPCLPGAELQEIAQDPEKGELYRIDDEWWFQDNWSRNNRNADWSYKDSENPVRYHAEWIMRSRESDYDYGTGTLRILAYWATWTSGRLQPAVHAQTRLRPVPSVNRG